MRGARLLIGDGDGPIPIDAGDGELTITGPPKAPVRVEPAGLAEEDLPLVRRLASHPRGLPAEGQLTFRPLRPGRYAVTVGTPEEGITGTTESKIIEVTGGVRD